MFISVLELFKIGIGPSSSHTLGPMVAANDFIKRINNLKITDLNLKKYFIRCTLKGSLAFTGKGHSTDQAVALGLHGHLPGSLTDRDVADTVKQIWQSTHICIDKHLSISFNPDNDIIFDKGAPLLEHPNGMVFELIGHDNRTIYSETYFSIGGGFINTLAEISQLQAPLKMQSSSSYKYPFDSANSMLQMAKESHFSIAQMKQVNELEDLTQSVLFEGMNRIWQSMQICLEKGLKSEGKLPGGLGVSRRAKDLYQSLKNNPVNANINDWLCAYAMAVNEENAAGNMVVTAPTNGAAGVIPAVLYYYMTHENGTQKQVLEFLLTASAIGGLIKHRSSISGAEVGCQGEVGSAAAMAAAGLCAVRGGTPQQVENAAEIALEHHLGMTCDPVNGLVQVPCIERNGFGAIKAYTAASLALRGSGVHFMPLDNCIAAMKQTGLEMSHKYKETSLGGLAVSITEC
ncbi:MAG: L-serine ammonia-lyase [gamma proteobacterium symbiont of Bathyaustriella thionipta]|nr:L-serine ammonia-lyase [gamma proteobacterium symbiont of Bathyaustriella thionipta]MCU7951053.1 L-serine ammonia-lyase [gamma proteobacterium symbiont of Bathyaustriella thionipta]MCU7954198.1 L-serine ammonia-lyase [gamma proteobacterium symbiont of Bathyaustriella thionipta]MCU7957558.1 L-serine ammonia-lyase [gamma proteobacterium symbiont of Bathyaustriella thionipta]MCU7967693.1 L-serine ammonia-lyase [gamma proteobacterium symbiont of Bathyaustriella thionipta]